MAQPQWRTKTARACAPGHPRERQHPYFTSLPVAGTEFATDECHQICRIFTAEDRHTMLDCGYDSDDIHPVSELPAVWDLTCPLRFISSADLTQRLVQQCEDATVSYELISPS